jgi:hypothetical protein
VRGSFLRLAHVASPLCADFIEPQAASPAGTQIVSVVFAGMTTCIVNRFHHYSISGKTPLIPSSAKEEFLDQASVVGGSIGVPTYIQSLPKLLS